MKTEQWASPISLKCIDVSPTASFVMVFITLNSVNNNYSAIFDWLSASIEDFTSSETGVFV